MAEGCNDLKIDADVVGSVEREIGHNAVDVAVFDPSSRFTAWTRVTTREWMPSCAVCRRAHESTGPSSLRITRTKLSERSRVHH